MVSVSLRPQVGLALGGGGARGLAHIGVLKVIQREGIPIDYIAGTSIGAIIGAAYAAGVKLDDIEALAKRVGRPREQVRMLDVRLTGRGLLKGTRLYRQFAGLMGKDLAFSDLQIPLEVMAVDLATGREVVIRSGSVVDAIRASMSVPGVFEPVEWKGMQLADGGLLNNVPVDVLCRANMDVKIAVDVLPNYPQNRPGQQPVVTHLESALLPLSMQQVMNSFMIMISEITEYRLRVCPPDVIIRPEITPKVSLLGGFERASEAIRAGEEAAEQALSEIVRAVSAASHTPSAHTTTA